ncbi:hypothetical protein DL93DRAFT_2074722, partial [Clavulina sp. PMI_390]
IQVGLIERGEREASEETRRLWREFLRKQKETERERQHLEKRRFRLSRPRMFPFLRKAQTNQKDSDTQTVGDAESVEMTAPHP